MYIWHLDLIGYEIIGIVIFTNFYNNRDFKLLKNKL